VTGGKEKVTKDEVLESVGASKESSAQLIKLSPIQRAGFYIAIGVGSLIAIVIIALLAELMGFRTPAIPTASAGIDDYQRLIELSSQRTLDLIDMIVAKILLPVFTTVLGYIFGSQAAAQTRN
jgi:hypothetical protein